MSKAKFIDLTSENENDNEFEPQRKMPRTDNTSSHPPMLPQASTFFMNRFNGVKDARSCLKISDIFQEEKPGDIMQVVIAHYSSSFSWLLNECPWLRNVPVLLLYPPSSSNQHHSLQIPNGWFASSVRMDFGKEKNEYGTFHSKIGLIFYSTGGVRVVISTNNFLEDEQNKMVGAFYVEDYPSKMS